MSTDRYVILKVPEVTPEQLSALHKLEKERVRTSGMQLKVLTSKYETGHGTYTVEVQIAVAFSSGINGFTTWKSKQELPLAVFTALEIFPTES